MVLFPVILPVIEDINGLPGGQKVARLSHIAREALRLSAEKCNITLEDPVKDEDDVPCPSNGIHWSLSHKPKCVAAVVSNARIGIDVEEIKPRTEQVFDTVASDEEWELGKDRSWDTFFRYWTAKEAALKAVGIGISGLKKCRVISIPDEKHITLDYQGSLFHIEQRYYGDHIVSVLKDDNEIQWVIAADFDHS